MSKIISKLSKISRIFTEHGAISTSKSVTFNGLNYQMEVGKNVFTCKPLEPTKWYNNSNVTFFLFSLYEIVFYKITGKALFSLFSFYFVGIFLVLSIIIFVRTHIFADSKLLRMNHGAEHKVLNAFLNRDLENADKYSRFSDGCGGNIFPMLMIFLSLSQLIKFPFTISLIYILMYTNIKKSRYIFYNTIGKFVQRFTTEEPTQEILDNTRKGFEKLISMEAEKLLEDVLEDMKKRVSNYDTA